MVSRESESDPVDDLLRRETFQRACVDLARASGDVIAGQVGDHGVSFLSAGGAGASRRQSLVELGEKAATLARRRYGLNLHLGIGTLASSASLSEHYGAALEAAEAAFSRGARIVQAEPRGRDQRPVLGDLRRQLGELAQERADLLPASFDRYLEAVALRCGYRLEPARAHLEAGFERMAEALFFGGAIDEKSFLDMAEGSSERPRKRVRSTSFSRPIARWSRRWVMPCDARCRPGNIAACSGPWSTSTSTTVSRSGSDGFSRCRVCPELFLGAVQTARRHDVRTLRSAAPHRAGQAASGQHRSRHAAYRAAVRFRNTTVPGADVAERARHDASRVSRANLVEAGPGGQGAVVGS